MQRNKLYNLHKTTYFMVALFLFKWKKTLSDQISTVRKWYCFLLQDKFVFSYFIFSWFVLWFYGTYISRAISWNYVKGIIYICSFPSFTYMLVPISVSFLSFWQVFSLITYGLSSFDVITHLFFQLYCYLFEMSKPLLNICYKYPLLSM